MNYKYDLFWFLVLLSEHHSSGSGDYTSYKIFKVEALHSPEAEEFALMDDRVHMNIEAIWNCGFDEPTLEDIEDMRSKHV